MKNLLRTLTLSAAALAALVAAPKSIAQELRRGGAHETSRGGSGSRAPSRGEHFRGHESRGREFRGGELRGRDSHVRGFARPPVISYGRRFAAPFRFYAGSRFYSYCPGPGYIYVDELGWVFPPFPGAAWIPAHLNRLGVRIDGCWR